MSKFKRVSLLGSEELFRSTRPELFSETDEVISDVLDHSSTVRELPKQYRQVSLTEDELELLIEAVQLSKYPDKTRPKPPLEKFERLDELKTKLQAE